MANCCTLLFLGGFPVRESKPGWFSMQWFSGKCSILSMQLILFTLLTNRRMDRHKYRRLQMLYLPPTQPINIVTPMTKSVSPTQPNRCSHHFPLSCLLFLHKDNHNFQTYFITPKLTQYLPNWQKPCRLWSLRMVPGPPEATYRFSPIKSWGHKTDW